MGLQRVTHDQAAFTHSHKLEQIVGKVKDNLKSQQTAQMPLNEKVDRLTGFSLVYMMRSVKLLKIKLCKKYSRKQARDFPGGPMAKTLGSCCRGYRFKP